MQDKISQLLNQLEKNLRNKNYFFNNKKRYFNDLALIKQYYQAGAILEIGSLPCHLTYCLKKLGYPVIGLDINPHLAKKFIEKHRLTVKKCDIERQKLPFKNNRFNLIIFNEVFEHLRIDPISALKEIHRALKPNGTIIVTTPNLYSLIRIIRFLRGKSFNDAWTEFNQLHTLGWTGHIREYSTSEMRRFLENTGFKIIRISYQSYFNYGGNLRQKTQLWIMNRLFSSFPRLRPFQIIIARKAPPSKPAA